MNAIQAARAIVSLSAAVVAGSVVYVEVQTRRLDRDITALQARMKHDREILFRSLEPKNYESHIG